MYRLKRFEYLKRPVEVKGIIDLCPQFIVETATDVLTRDGIPLQIRCSMSYQIEPKSITDGRSSSRFERGEAHTRVLGLPEYPVYEATIRKAVFATPASGWKGLFPLGPISTLRDVVATYALYEVFPFHDPNGTASEHSIIRGIEEQVNERFDSSWAGVWFRGLDILGITIPEQIQKLMLRRYERQLDDEGAEETGRDDAIQSNKLLQILTTRFNAGELRTLCFGLEIDYDDLPGEGRAEKARELLRYLERRNRIYDLVEAGKQQRPDIPWNDLDRA